MAREIIIDKIPKGLCRRTQKWINIVISCIKVIQDDFKANKGLLLTEGDLQCMLYKKLASKKDSFSIRQSKTSGWKTGFIHSEVTWFKPEKESGFEVDLTILDPTKLNIKTFEDVQEQDYANKGFFYNGECVAIELKFIRNTQSVLSKAREDYEKVVNGLIPSIKERKVAEKYSEMNMKNVGFVIVVACKTEEIYDSVFLELTSIIGSQRPENVFPIMFSHTRSLNFQTNKPL